MRRPEVLRIWGELSGSAMYRASGLYGCDEGFREVNFDRRSGHVGAS